MILDLRPGVTETSQYKAWKFPGGEIHVQFKDWDHEYRIKARLNTTDQLLFFLIARDTLRKAGYTESGKKFFVNVPYWPYQQADRDFSMNECFSLKTIASLLAAPDTVFTSFDVHSDVTPALVPGMKVITNHQFIESAVESILDENLILLSPDAGAYKKIFKLAQALHKQREIVSANKSRSISTGNIDSIELSRQDFHQRPVLIVDDICMGGRTFIELAKKLQERNVGDVYLAVSHGVFSNGFEELSKYFKKIFTTNSFQDKYESDIVLTYDVFG